MGAIAIVVFAFLLLALLTALVLILIGPMSTQLRKGRSPNSPRGFAELAQRDGWAYVEKDPALPQRLAVPAPPGSRIGAAQDVLHRRTHDQELLIFQCPVTDTAGTTTLLNVWALRLPPHLLDDPARQGTGDASQEARIHALPNGNPRFRELFGGPRPLAWRLSGHWLLSWEWAAGKYKTRYLLTRAAPSPKRSSPLPPERDRNTAPVARAGRARCEPVRSLREMLSPSSPRPPW